MNPPSYQQQPRDLIDGLKAESASNGLVNVVLLPVGNIVESYDSLIAPFMQQMRHGLIGNTEPTRLRDWLLPLLMNGQVRVA